MANISDAFGTYTLCGTWSDEMIKRANILRDEWGDWYYNTIIDEEFNAEQTEYSFLGSGRWAYCWNLESLGTWTKNDAEDKVLKAYIELCRDMEKNGAYIQIDYADDECGCGVLYEATARISAKDGEFVYEEIECENYEYTPENLIKLHFYEDIDDFLESNCFEDCDECGHKKLCEKAKFQLLNSKVEANK